MNGEYLQIAAMVGGGLLFTIGGTGWKLARRFVLPVFLGILVFLAGFFWWKAIILCLGLIVALCLPYGEKTPYWAKFLAGCAFVAPTAILGFSWWQILTPVAFILMFWLSNWKPTAKIFFWKAVEFFTGGLIGITAASFIK